jgi:hypothetical protein
MSQAYIRIRGHRTQQAREALYDEVVHRDNLG